VVKNHYSDLGTRLTRVDMRRDQWLYTSYRVGAAVYWTRHMVRVRAGETVLSDGTHMIRGRCGNRLSAVPNKPTRLMDPPSVLDDTPTVVTENKPPDTPFDLVGGGEPEEIPVTLPDPQGTPLTHPLPPVSLAPKPETLTVTHRTITGPAAALLPPRATTATITAPEPGTWAMMLSGLGIIGFAARRGRKAPRS
jgi:hypothetical protein